MRLISRCAIVALSLAAVHGVTASAATLVPIGHFEKPIFVTSAPSAPDDLLVVERQGQVVRDDSGTISPYGDLNATTTLVACCESERGLLSIAPAPDFATSGRFYAAYTGTEAAGSEEGDVHLDAFRPAGGGSDALLREPILAIPHSQMANHNGGQLEWGPDGYLYMSVGDGGGTGDPLGSGQNVETLLGKILRIEPRPGAEPPYAIPPGNPFVGQPGRDEIWAYGLRNPWRFSFDRLSGDMVIGDVGQGEREEVDFASSPSPGVVGGAGANYGWNCREGFIAYSGAPASCLGAGGFIDPVFDYPHNDPGGGAAHGCAILGGYVLHDPALGELDGRYVYADLCVGEIRSLRLPVSAPGLASGDRGSGLMVSEPNSFGEDACGRVYVASGDGTVFRLEGSAGAACPVIPAATQPPAVEVTVIRRSIHVRLRVRRRPHSRVARLIVTVTPCGADRGAFVELRRDGRRFAQRRLNGRCVARFRVRLTATARFRAVFGDQRSQVRTIALAKPRP